MAATRIEASSTSKSIKRLISLIADFCQSSALRWRFCDSRRVFTLVVVLASVLVAESVRAQDGVEYAPSAPESAALLGSSAAGTAKINSSGAAAHSIPLVVPPGTAGMAPQLSLSYSSQSQDNRFLGLAWSLKGLPAIERCAATLAQGDGFRGGINYSTDDRFCLDGARLILTSGTYGGDGAQYRTEIDSGVRIISKGSIPGGSGPSYFTLRTKAGEVLEFGNTQDSKVEAQGIQSVRVWALNKRTDSSGNYFTVTYIEDNANGDYRPDQIDYTGNTGLTPTRSVKFVYEVGGARPTTDISPSYIGGSVVKSMVRLIAVRTYVSGALVKDYRLSYEISAATKRSRLTQVRECIDLNPPTSTNCLPPTTFTWQNAGTTFAAATTWGNSQIQSNPNGLSQWIADFNGDGKTDLMSYWDSTTAKVHISTGSGFVVQDWAIQMYASDGHFNWVGDFNGDGRTDMAIYVSSNQINLYLSNGNNFAAPIPINLTLHNNAHWTYIGDFNGDGRADILARITDSTANVYISTGTGFTAYENLTGFNFGSAPDWNFVGDFNGDGKSDIASRYNGSNVQMHLANQAGTGFLTPTLWQVSLGDAPSKHFLGDFNGDGKTDILRFNGVMMISKGDNFATPTTWTNSLKANQAYLKIGDFNGDGKSDIASIESSNTTEIHFSTGTSFEFGAFTTTDTSGYSFPGLFRIGDFDGDGKSDLINMNPENAIVTNPRMNLLNGPFPDLITTIDNGFGSVTTLNYKPISDPTVYATDAAVPEFAAVYPEKEFQQPIYVVSNMTVDNGVGGSFPYSYTYGGGKMRQDGRGWLGFRWRETTDSTVKSLTKEFLNQNFPFTGTARETEIYDITVPTAPALMLETNQTYVDPAIGPSSGVFFVQLLQSDKLEWDGQSTPRQSRTTFTFDLHNNPVTKTYTGDGADQRVETTEWVFKTDADDWLHRPKRSELRNHLNQVVREKWLFYDGQAWGTLPTGAPGRVTREESRVGSTTNLGDPLNYFLNYGHDPFGNRTLVEDPREVSPGQFCQTITTYETTHRTYPAAITNCLGHQTDLVYDARFGVVASKTEPHHASDSPVPTTTSEYDFFGRLSKIVSPLDSPTFPTAKHEYLNRGILNPGNLASSQQTVTYRTEQHGTGNTLVSKEYFDGLRRPDVTEQEGPGSEVIRSESVYDSRGLVLQKSAPHFESETAVDTLIAYDVLGRVKRIDNPDGTFVTKSYNKGLVTTINERGKRKDEFFDVYGQLKTVIEYNEGQTYTTDYAYDAAGSLLTVTNALDHVTSLGYDLVGRKTSMQDPNMGLWTYEYFRSGDLGRQTDGRNIALDFTYDGLGRIKTKKQGSTTLASWTYDDALVAHSKGRLTRVIDSNALGTLADTKLSYDVLGRVTQTLRTIDGTNNYTMSQSYDALNRISVETFPDGDTACYLYNNAGWLRAVGKWANPSCIETGEYVNSISYNARGQKLSLQYANGLTTSWNYFANNFRLQSRQTLAGGTHATVALARWTKSWTTQEPLPPPSGFANLYAGGICVRDGAGACIGGDAMVENLGSSVLGYIKTSSGTGTVPVYQSTGYVNSGGSAIGWGLSLSADGAVAGHLSLTAPDSQSALVPFIQSNGLLLQGLSGTASAYLWSVQTGAVDHTDHYYLTTGSPPGGYTSEGNTAFVDAASSGGTVALVRYENSTTGHHYYSTVSDPPSGFGGGAIIGHLHSTGGSGLIELYRHYNSTTGDYLITTSSSPPGGYVMQALLGYGHTSGVTSTQQNLAYTYDEVGNVKTVTDTISTGSRSFQYDDLNRLKQAIGTFGQNQAQTTHDYTYDAIGNILSKAGISYCYGYMGACPDTRLSGVKTTSDGATYSYDDNGNILTGAGRTYTWNGDNRLDTVASPGGSAVMTYDYTGIRIKKSGSSGTTIFPFTGYEDRGGTITKFIRIGNEIIASKEGTSTRRFYHNDHLGGVNIISDFNGNQVQLTEYDPWGKVSRSDGTVDPTHRFTGQELDSESDVHYYGGRYYDQGLARFMILLKNPLFAKIRDEQYH